jgi:hypothetical protein
MFKIGYIPVRLKQSATADGCTSKFDFDGDGTFSKVICPPRESAREDRTYLQYSASTNAIARYRVPGKRTQKESLDSFKRQQARHHDAKSFDTIHQQLLQTNSRAFYSTAGPLGEYSEQALKNKTLLTSQIGDVRGRINPDVKRSHSAWEPPGCPHTKHNPFQKPFADERRKKAMSRWEKRATMRKAVVDQVAEWENDNNEHVDWGEQTKDELQDTVLRQEEKLRQQRMKTMVLLAGEEGSMRFHSSMASTVLASSIIDGGEEEPTLEESSTDKKVREKLEKEKNKPPPPPMRKPDYLEKVHALFASHTAPSLKQAVKIGGEYFIATLQRAACRASEEFRDPEALQTGADSKKGGIRLKVHGVESCEVREAMHSCMAEH